MAQLYISHNHTTRIPFFDSIPHGHNHENHVLRLLEITPRCLAAIPIDHNR